MQKTNDERLQEIAEGLSSLNERLVYVGGAMAGSYADDPAATEPRTTIDVDCVVNSTNYAEYIVDSGIDYWIYGHSHRNIDAEIGRTKIRTNQLGYVHQDEQLYNGFNAEQHIII